MLKQGADGLRLLAVSLHRRVFINPAGRGDTLTLPYPSPIGA